MSNVFSKFATSIAGMSGKPGAFVLAVTLVLVWAISGPFFGYSETWQLVINTSTTNHHVPDGLRPAELAESRWQGFAGQARRAHSDLAGSEQVRWDRKAR
ncbi:hypothetical protein ACVI1T_004954 [Rhizobium redzepovicii]